MIRLIHLSDPHLLAATDDGQNAVSKGVRPNARFQRAVEQIRSMRPAPMCCVITGDLVAVEDVQHYLTLEKLCRQLPAPVHFALGNHDDRRLFWDIFGVPTSPLPLEGDRHCYSFLLTDPGSGLRVRCWILDSHLAGEVAGALGEAQLAWLARGLQHERADRHLIFVHHPAVSPGSAWMEDMLLRDGEQLLDVLTSTKASIGRVLFGHVHQSITATVRGIGLTSAPSTGYQFTDAEVTPKVHGGTAGYHVVSLSQQATITTVVPILDDTSSDKGSGHA